MVITRDQYTKDFYIGGGTSQTFSVTVAATASILVVLSHNQNARSYTSVTANGQAMTEVVDQAVGVVNDRVGAYVLPNPPTGTYNIIVTVSGTTNDMITWAYSLIGTETVNYLGGYGAAGVGSASSQTLGSPACTYPPQTWWIGLGASSNSFTYPYSGSATELDSYNTGYKTTLFDTSAVGQIPAWWNDGISFTTDTDKGNTVLVAVGISAPIVGPFPTNLY